MPLARNLGRKLVLTTKGASREREQPQKKKGKKGIGMTYSYFVRGFLCDDMPSAVPPLMNDVPYFSSPPPLEGSGGKEMRLLKKESRGDSSQETAG